MESTVIVAVISAIGTAIGSVVGICINSSLTRWRLKELEKKVELHNNAVERLVIVENKISNTSERVERLERRAHTKTQEAQTIYS